MEATPQQPAPVSPPLLTPRQRIVGEAVRVWTRQLIDLGGRNNLLYFRDLKVGTLDLSASVGGPLAERLLEGKPVRLSQLFPIELDLKDAAKRARTLRGKAIENEEERGLQTLHLGYGMATWRSDRSAALPNAPVLLYKLTLHPQGLAGEDFGVETDSEPELNPTLIHLLETDFGVHIVADDLLAAATLPEAELPDVEAVMRLFAEACKDIPGFVISERLVVGNFSYAKLPMVRDLERAHDAINQHPLLSAIAGDEPAREELRGRFRDAEAMRLPVVPPPSEEFLVLDADSSQSSVISAALAGSDVVVIGPPGTGKSQTISNLIATLVARGKSVLFVAEKRAAIDAVVARLNKRGLGDLILDLHDGASNRRRVAGELDRALESTGDALAPDVTRLHRQLERRRAELEQYADQLHAPMAPWDISAFEAQSRILGVPASSRSVVRLRGAALEALLPPVITEACEDAQRFMELGGALVSRPEHPWATTFAASGASDANAVRALLDLVHSLRSDLLPQLRSQLAAVGNALGLAEVTTAQRADRIAALLTDANSVLTSFEPAIFDSDLSPTVRAMAPARSGFPSQFFSSIFNGGYKSARKQLRSLSKIAGASDARLLEGAVEAYTAQQQWGIVIGSGIAHPVGGSEDLIATHSQLWEYMARFKQEANIDLAALNAFDLIEAKLAALEADSAILSRFPELQRLNAEVRAVHLGPALDAALTAGLSGIDTSLLIEHAWLSSILDEIKVKQPALAAFTVEGQEAATRDFVTADHAHIEVAADRVRRAWAERATRTRDQYPAEAAHVARQASLKRRHMPLRDLFDRAEHVLTAVKPCWVMSPLVVAQVLPTRDCFDVVVFDEASQILPADAACSLLRGRRAVVAGDPHQLPPTIFFSTGADDEEDEEAMLAEAEPEVAAAMEAALTQGQESILDVLRALLPPPHGTRVLSWHYRSKDERLITFSNAQESLYDWSLTTFPGALPGDAISHVLVPFVSKSDKVTASAPEEVTRVVELVKEHATVRPEESLGVIALGITHADNISEALRLASLESPELAALMDESKPERFFVKNLERVQGDERDAIILTVGYGKTADGRMRYNFGPINQQGGQRRLNVAITRARRRMTVVSSFGGSEMDPERTTSIGARMLRDYLLYAESRGTNLGAHTRPKSPLLPFERHVQARLEAEGMVVVPQYGASDKYIDFAIMDPADSQHPLMAVEADGKNYHDSPSARDRDRLRQEHLERLGWLFQRVWSTDWFTDPDAEVARVKAAYDKATRPADELPSIAAVPAPDWMPAGSNAPRTARQAWPSIRRGLGIEDYSPRQLREVVRWVKSDGRLYTEEELRIEVMEALRFSRRGTRIDAAIQDAIAADR